MASPLFVSGIVLAVIVHRDLSTPLQFNIVTSGGQQVNLLSKRSILHGFIAGMIAEELAR
jgi:hypothetical protein